MKRLLVVSFIIGLLSASIHALSTEPEQNAASPTQYYAPTNCVPFTQNSDPDAGVRNLLAHPGTRVCPGPHTDPAETARILQDGAAERAAAGRTLRCSMSGHVC